MNEKMYILDTNVLLYDPRSWNTFVGAHVAIPGAMIEELDQFKREGTDRGQAARTVIHLLDDLRQKGSLREGVKLDNGATIRVVFLETDAKYKIPFSLDIKDNQALLTAYMLKQQGYDVHFVTKDLNARVKADALGIIAVDYITEKITAQDFYHGWIRIPVPSVQLKKDNPEELQTVLEEHTLCRNQFVILESQHNTHNYRVFRYVGNNKFIAIDETSLRWPFQARNPQQLMALNILLDPTIQLITLFGPAGTGKTFLALLAGLHQVVIEHLFQKLLIARPIIPLGKDVGYLPGTLEEKLHTWMLPVFDNMEFIFQKAPTNTGSMGRQGDRHLDNVKDEYYDAGNQRNGNHRQRRGKFHHNGRDHRHQNHDTYKHRNEHLTGISPLDDLIEKGKISLEAITYMRGRSIPYQYIFIDEVQNLTPHEVKTLVSRVGEGSKIVLAGDPYQIDTPYLDFSTNGLVVTSEKFKGQDVFASVYLETSERSLLAKLATELL